MWYKNYRFPETLQPTTKYVVFIFFGEFTFLATFFIHHTSFATCFLGRHWCVCVWERGLYCKSKKKILASVNETMLWLKLNAAKVMERVNNTNTGQDVSVFEAIRISVFDETLPNRFRMLDVEEFSDTVQLIPEDEGFGRPAVITLLTLFFYYSFLI